MNLDYSFSPRLSLSSFIEYGNEFRNIGLQARVRWIWKPGKEVYFALNHAWQQDPLDRFEALRTNFRVTPSASEQVSGEQSGFPA